MFIVCEGFFMFKLIFTKASTKADECNEMIDWILCTNYLHLVRKIILILLCFVLVIFASILAAVLCMAMILSSAVVVWVVVPKLRCILGNVVIFAFHQSSRTYARRWSSVDRLHCQLRILRNWDRYTYQKEQPFSVWLIFWLKV